MQSSTDNKHHLLIVDDDKRIRSLLSQFLSKHGYMITSVEDASQARKALEIFQFDLIVLDVMLPKELGTDFAKQLKETSNIAILMLTAMGSTEDKIKGLEAGADDYISKPFEPKELLLRIEKLLQRTKYYSQQSHDLIKLGKVSYDLSRKLLLINSSTVSHNNDADSTILSSQEIKLLEIFIANKGKVIDREQLASQLEINPRSVDVQITRLRNKIEINPKKPLVLQTVRGSGYAIYV